MLSISFHLLMVDAGRCRSGGQTACELPPVSKHDHAGEARVVKLDGSNLSLLSISYSIAASGHQYRSVLGHHGRISYGMATVEIYQDFAVHIE
jgi:hypothetical protein